MTGGAGHDGPMPRKIIGVVGMPRSGTSWLGQIFDSSPRVAYRLEPIFSYAFKNAIDENSSQAEVGDFFRDVHASDDPFLLQTEKRDAGVYPSFEKQGEVDTSVFKTTRFHHILRHLLEVEERLQLVGIVRHPCGAISSWLNTPREFPAAADPMAEWRSGTCRKTAVEEYWGFEDWKAITRLHMDLARSFPTRFKLLRYEDLVANPLARIRDVFQFCGLTPEAQTEGFLTSCHEEHNTDSYAVFKHPRVATRWREVLPESIQAEIIEEVTGTDLECFLEDAK